MITDNIQDFIKIISQSGKILAIDFGTKKLGIAVSNVERTMTWPLKVLKYNMTDLCKLISDQKPIAIVVGVPVNMDGSNSASAQQVMIFADNLYKLASLPIFLQDERLTSRAAASLLKDAGMKRKERDAVDDAVAAALILDTVLSRINH